MSSKNGHVPALLVVGLGMVLIAALAGVAVWFWSRRRVPAVAAAAPAALPIGPTAEA